ncbi:major capsid protein [Mycobacterium phage Gaia]|uniref:Major capsid protein n=1 Tax=Mycobacterium phage Gaia TaxID=1486472 RepID=A0A068F8K1_9CAUD|nr:major head protein [Mycobacterium phage Gaia]AID58825.1 major capsid protein [Mycobacterium phage Gaia]AYQ99947.1 major capsid protein [Mycobacterium phage Nebkiss]
MAGITGTGTTFNLPNFVGELYSASPEDTPFLSAIGGLTGGVPVHGSSVFTWSSYDLRDAEDDRQRVEGNDAPTAEGRARAVASNVLEIHQEAVSVSYTKIAATNMFGGTAPFVGGLNPVQDELAWQLRQEFKQVARDVEKSFITGTYNMPANNSTARRTRGIIEAISTNSVDLEDASLTADDVLDLMQSVWASGGIQEAETRTLLVGGSVRRQLSKLFITDAGYKEQSRNVGGVSVKTIETDFGLCNVMLDRYVPDDTLLVVSLEECTPRFLEIPGKGHFFAEPLAKTGASDRVQLYGEIGLEYGNERKHGKLEGIGAPSSGS